MSAIQSTTPIGDTQLLNIPIHIDINTNQIENHVDGALSGVISAAHDALKKISAPLDEYFDKLGEEIKSNMTAITSAIEKINWEDKKSIMDGLQPILDYLKPVFEFIAKNPWALAPILIPVLALFFVILGFGTAGVVAGSIAAILQSSIGNPPKGSLFSFFQSAGAREWAFKALRGNTFITIAVLLVVVGMVLVDKGIVDPDAAGNALEDAWNSTLKSFNPTTADSASSQGTVLNLNIDHGWARYGIVAWLLMYGAIHAGEF